MSRRVAALCVTLALVAAFSVGASASRAKDPAPGEAGSFTLVYETRWPTTYLHYNPDSRGWNGVPGRAMACPTINTSSYPCPAYAQVSVWGNSVVFVTTNGAGQWDNNGGRNYATNHAGTWLLQGGQLTMLAPAANGCPEGCNGHGTCDAQTLTCACAVGWWGATCGNKCAAPCSAAQHESCSQHNGRCVCAPGWAKCAGNAGCDTNTSADINNCGACGRACRAGAHVATAACVAGRCVVTCAAGYIACDDGTCRTECPLPGCLTYGLNHCAGNTITTNASFAANNWQTPMRGAPGYRNSYQDYAHLKAHVSYRYAADRRSVTLLVKPQTRNPAAKVTCSFGQGAPFGACSRLVSAPTRGPMPVRVRAHDAAGVYNLVLEDVDFIWDHPSIAHTAGDYREGQKGSIVELFGWPHREVGDECAFLARAGYLGAKLFPVQEQVMSVQPFQNSMNPWYFMYQPVSYRLQGRMGSRDELRAAIDRCRALNVRIYADAVVNHMVGNGNDANQKHRAGNGGYCATWPGKNTSADFGPSGPAPGAGRVNGSSPLWTQGYTFEPAANTGLPPMQEFPAVPYGPLDFHCERALNSWTDPLDLNAGWLSGLVDLNTERDSVRERIADYYTDLLSIGMSGFRIDAGKHIRPPDHAAIFAKLKRNLGGSFPPDFHVWLEVLTGGEADMLLADPTSPYSYSVGLETDLANAGLTPAEIESIRIWFDCYPKQPGCDGGQLSMKRKAIQNDDADQQTSGSTSRDMQNYGTVLVIAKDIPLHRHFEKQLFLAPNGASDNDNQYPIRMVLSSFWLPADLSDYGIADGKSNCDLCQISCTTCDPATSLNYTKAYRAGSTGYDGGFVGGHYTRPHRDAEIVNAMRSWVHLPPLEAHELL